MNSVLIYPRGSTDACVQAAFFLKHAGFCLTDHPCPETTHLLLDVPSFDAAGRLRGGEDLGRILEMLPPVVTVIGGNLHHPALAEHNTFDLLQEPVYLANNAAVTAECALRLAGSLLPTIFSDSPALVIGWGRIGKCLAKYLSALGCPVTVAARKASDRAMIGALGWNAIDIPEISKILPNTRLLFNTVPAPILPADMLNTHKNCIKIDLASIPGLSGSNVVSARGLPGKYAPESSGKQIAQAIIRRLKEEAA